MPAWVGFAVAGPAAAAVTAAAITVVRYIFFLPSPSVPIPAPSPPQPSPVCSVPFWVRFDDGDDALLSGFDFVRPCFLLPLVRVVPAVVWCVLCPGGVYVCLHVNGKQAGAGGGPRRRLKGRRGCFSLFGGRAEGTPVYVCIMLHVRFPGFPHCRSFCLTASCALSPHPFGTEEKLVFSCARTARRRRRRRWTDTTAAIR